VTADDQSKVYGEPDPALTFQVTLGSLAPGDSFTGALARDPGEDVGTYKIKQGSLTIVRSDVDQMRNYDFTFVEGTFKIVHRPTMLTYTWATTGQYSDPVTLSAELLDVTDPDNPTPIQGKTITFTLNGLSTSADTGENGVATATLVLSQAPNGYTVTAAFAGDAIYAGSSDSKAFTITPEDATVEYIGVTFVWTLSATSGKAVVNLVARVTDENDGNRGDVRNAKVSFYNGSDLIATVPVGLVNPGDPTVGVATYSWNVDIGNADGATFAIRLEVGGHYTGSATATVEVAKPLESFITGGGWVDGSGSQGMYAADPGSHVNFGFNVKYNKRMTNLQGQATIVVRSGGRVYLVKSNAIQSLTVDPWTAKKTTGTAQFTSKASIQDITDPLNPIPIDGNATLILTMTDRGEPGSQDSIAIAVYNKQGGLWFSTGGEKTLQGGNLAVH
ncbi:MAG: MBG domain-containing protein, partial [Thermofilaceae archaeon]